MIHAVKAHTVPCSSSVPTASSITCLQHYRCTSCWVVQYSPDRFQAKFGIVKRWLYEWMISIQPPVPVKTKPLWCLRALAPCFTVEHCSVGVLTFQHHLCFDFHAPLHSAVLVWSVAHTGRVACRDSWEHFNVKNMLYSTFDLYVALLACAAEACQ